MKRYNLQWDALEVLTGMDESNVGEWVRYIDVAPLENHLLAVMEHIAPMLKLYEPNMPEHPVIAAIRDYLEKP